MSLDDLKSPDAQQPSTEPAIHPLQTRRWPAIVALTLASIVLLAGIAFAVTRARLRSEMRANLPQLDGSLTVYGLHAPVTVTRDARGVPHIHAASMDDLIFAQGFITAQDRLWQMDLLRRHGAGQLAAVIGPGMIPHDRAQRTLQLRAAADRAAAALPPGQKHWLEVYARGVNASIGVQHDHLPIEFRLIGYQPLPWTPRDSLLVELVMFQDLTTGYVDKLGREALATQLPPDLIADLYPTGSWRDHAPGAPIPDVTAPQPEFKDAPLDESQSKLHPATKPGTPHLAATEPGAPHLVSEMGEVSATKSNPTDLLTLRQTLALFNPPCPTCVAGSNGWAVAGSRTASGKPLVSNDMHLNLAAPGVWYEADLEAENPAPLTGFHAAGVTLPGTPFVVVGHNAHVAWGFTNLGADVQDLYIEHTRGTTSGAEYQLPNGDWRPVHYQQEIIHVRGSADVTLDVPIVRHGKLDIPVISGILGSERRTISLCWTVYDPTAVTAPFFAINSATDGPSLLAAISTWGGPAQNMTYADDQGHIGYHAVGRIPVRGDVNNPTPLSPVPTDATAPDAASHEWAAYLPFDLLPQALDPPDGVLATANARVTPDGYRYPITLNWMAPYRTERIYKVLESGSHLTPADMLALQTDVSSTLDHLIAQRLAYSIDHATGPLKNDKTLHQAADILRNWNGHVDADSPAAAIVNAARDVFWPMVLIPKLAPQVAPQLAQGTDLRELKSLSPDVARAVNMWPLYAWGERGAVEEQMLTHTPARWLPSTYTNWNDFLSAVVLRGLKENHAPQDLSTWSHGKAFPLAAEHPIFSREPYLQRLIGIPTGTGPQPHSGDGTTIDQIRILAPSERLTVDLADPDLTTLNIVLGQSGNPASPWYMDQFQSWLHGTTYPMPFSAAATQAAAAHTLTLTPR